MNEAKCQHRKGRDYHHQAAAGFNARRCWPGEHAQRSRMHAQEEEGFAAVPPFDFLWLILWLFFFPENGKRSDRRQCINCKQPSSKPEEGKWWAMSGCSSSANLQGHPQFRWVHALLGEDLRNELALTKERRVLQKQVSGWWAQGVALAWHPFQQVHKELLLLGPCDVARYSCVKHFLGDYPPKQVSTELIDLGFHTIFVIRGMEDGGTDAQIIHKQVSIWRGTGEINTTKLLRAWEISNWLYYLETLSHACTTPT